MNDLEKLATLIGRRNDIDREIAGVLGRPVHVGHLFEFVASQIFDIALNESASQKASDGVFRGGAIAGRTVNVKYTARHQGILNMGTSLESDTHPDFYLMLAGPRSAPGSSTNTQAPLCIESVYLFESSSLLNELLARGMRPGIARSIPRIVWEAAMIYPEARNPLLPLVPEQCSALGLFACQPPGAVCPIR